jgi:hypothetical protein
MLKLAVIADHEAARQFELDVLDAVEGCSGYTLFSCTSSRPDGGGLGHAAYRALNPVSPRGRLTRLVPLERGARRIERIVRFEAEPDGAGQRLPAEVVAALREGGFDVILKLGMGLLRVPPAETLSTPILAFHHGDPERYRGGPAGFWEIARGEGVIGQAVQAIGDDGDAGRIAAYAETKVYPWSWRATLMEAYRHSPLIINQAIRNAVAGTWLDKPGAGRSHGLPGNGTVAALAARMGARTAARLLYGATMEKRWQVSHAPVPEAGLPALLEGRAPLAAEGWQTLKVGDRHVFYADPFFSTDPPGILVEALDGSGRGEIVFAPQDGGAHRVVSALPGHMSYPATVELGGRQLILPEMASFSPPRLFVLQDGAMREIGPLPLEREERILDPTLAEHEGRLYLFGNIRSLGSHVLCLWSADTLDGPFRLHPQSPLRVSPRGSRMGGNLLRVDGRLVRLGQNFEAGYGDGVFAFEIEELSAERYRERALGLVRFSHCRGPHTLNVAGGRVLFDWYEERFAPMAGFRRLLGWLRARRLASAGNAVPPALEPGSARPARDSLQG